MRWFVVLVAALFLTGCEYEEVVRETGYKGKARVNPWLAAERFTERMGEDVVSVIAWTEPKPGDSVWVMPATTLGNESFTLRMEEWVNEGGHLILLVEHADAETNDWFGWHPPPVIEPALKAMLERARLHPHQGAKVTAHKIRFQKETFKVDADSNFAVSKGEGKNSVFASARLGKGRITVLTDGRIFRNRWIADNDHAALLSALIGSSDHEGRVGFMRGAGLSLLSLMGEHLTPVLLVLAAWLMLWLWKSLSRFGPVESSTPPTLLRGYGHHLEALGHFHWKLDHAATLLPPLRERINEFGHRACLAAGRAPRELHAFLAERADLPEERISRVLSETPPSDPASLTRTTADLQKLLQVLKYPSMS
jgi:hypothetical protein